MSRIFLIAALLLPLTAGAQPATAELETLIAKTLNDWQVPGASVAIIRGDEAVLVKGFGYRNLEKKEPVTEKTLFRLASVTKSFTASGIAALVTQGKLEWNKPVRDYLPEFRLYNDDLTAHVTPSDLLSHRTGLPRHDAIWYFNRDVPREELIRRLRYMEPNKGLREAYQYNNFMFLTAGYLTGRMLGTRWEDAVRKLIFKPLRMTATDISIEEMEKNRDHATPYQKDKKDVVRQVPNYPGNNLAPAGQINSNAEEMARYVSMLMHQGQFEGKQVLAKADVQKMTTAQMVVSGPPDPRYPELGDSAYGFGLGISNYRGHRLVQHGGALDGFRANLAFLPEDQIAIVVLSNLGQANFVGALTYDLFDRLLNLPQRDWSQRYLSDERKGKAARDEAEGKGYTGRISGTQPSHALADYAGQYEHPAYGAVRVGEAGGKLSVQYGYVSTELTHFHYDTFEFVTDPVDQDKYPLKFDTDAEGEIVSLAIPMEPLVSPIVFKRVADPRMRTRAFLEPYTGRYDFGATTVEVTLRDDNVLLLRQPTGLSQELEPVRGTTFRVKDRAGWTLEFKPETGEAVLHMPGSSSVLKRKP